VKPEPLAQIPPTPPARVVASEPTNPNAALFPAVLLPTLSPIQPVKPGASQEAKRGETPDEFIGLVALLGLLRLLSRRD